MMLKKLHCLSFRPLYAAAIALLLGFGFATTQAQEEPAAPRTGVSGTSETLRIPLKVSWLPDPKSTDIAAKAQLEVIREFKNRYPEIELAAFSGISIEGMADDSSMMLAIAGGSSPDVMQYVPFRMSDTFIQQAFLYPLDDFIQRTHPGGLAKYLQETPPSIQPVIYRAGPSIDGIPAGKHVWGLYGDLLVRVLMWRKDRFQEAGLDPNKPPETWDELLEYAKRLTDPEKNRYGMSLSSGLQAAWDYTAFLWSAGGDAVVLNKDGEWIAAFDSREAAVALDFYIKIATEEWMDSSGRIQRGYTALSDSSSDTEKARAWAEGRLGMQVGYLDSRSMGGDSDPALIGIAPVPKGPTGLRGSEINSVMQGIFSNIKGRTNSEGKYVSAEKVREAAWKYIYFVNSEDARRITAKVFVDNGRGRSLSPKWLRDFGYTEYLKYFPPEFEEIFNQAIQEGTPEPYGKNCQLVYFYMTKPIDELLQMSREGKLPLGDDPATVERRLDKIQEELTKAVNDTNVRMIGKLPPEERAKRNAIALIVAILICALVCFALYKIWIIFSPKDSFTGRKKGLELHKNWMGYLIMIPALLSILLWVYSPMVLGSSLLFQDYRIVDGFSSPNWIGLNNLADVLYSKEWWGSVYNTLRYMILILSLGFLAPIFLAILLQEVSHGKILYRTLFYLPAVMSGLVVIYMWKLFYQSGPTGIMNQFFASIVEFFGGTYTPIAWLEDKKWAMLACVIPSVWASAGPGCLIYLAALKGVPDDIYEAAEIDGANFFQKIWHVTLPTIKALIIINFVGAFIGAAQSGGMILVMTFGRAGTEVAELHIFKEAYTNLKFGSAIAMAWILGITTLCFTIYQLRRLSNMEFKTTGNK